MKLRFRVKMWGSQEYPDLDYETDDPPRTLMGFDYPFVSIACLTAIPHSVLMADLEKKSEFRATSA
jgi:hypothetical protein